MDPKKENRKVIVNIKFDIDDQEGLQRKLESLKRWYNTHWFVDRGVMIEQAKRYVLEHLRIILVDEDEKIWYNDHVELEKEEYTVKE